MIAMTLAEVAAAIWRLVGSAEPAPWSPGR